MKKHVWLFVPLLFVSLFIFIYPSLRIGWLSFTDFNMLKSPVFNNGANYIAIFNDKLFLLATSNMFLFTITSTIMGGLIAFTLYRASSQWSTTVRIIWSVILVSLSVIALSNVSLTYILSGDTYGLINGHLLNRNIISQPILFLNEPTFLKPISILLTIITMVGPLYVFFNASKASMKGKLIIAANIGIIVNIINYMTQIMVFGFPSTNYQVHNPIIHIYDYAIIRYDVGVACAMIVVTLIFIVIIAAILSGIAWLISFVKLGGKPFLVTKIIGCIICAFSFLLIGFDLLVKVRNVFMPLSEKFSFPPKLFVLRPTLENFKHLIKIGLLVKILSAIVAQVTIGGLVFCLIILPAGYILSNFSNSKGCLRAFIISGLSISIVAPFCALLLPPITNYIQLAFYSSVMSPFMIPSLFVIAYSIRRKKYVSGVLAGLMIFVFGSFTNSFIFSYKYPGLWTLLAPNAIDFVSPILVAMIFGITAVIATVFTGIALYDSKEIQINKTTINDTVKLSQVE